MTVVKVSQGSVEVGYNQQAKERVSQALVELLQSESERLRVEQALVEIVEKPIPHAVFNQALAEVLYLQSTAPIKCYQVVVEVGYVLPEGQIFVSGVQYAE